MQTFDGIDTGGDRLVKEVRLYVSQHPDLQYISVLGHSMGGLIARYCIGMRPASSNLLLAFAL